VDHAAFGGFVNDGFGLVKLAQGIFALILTDSQSDIFDVAFGSGSEGTVAQTPIFVLARALDC
jgi:hypothetical protein